MHVCLRRYEIDGVLGIRSYAPGWESTMIRSCFHFRCIALSALTIKQSLDYLPVQRGLRFSVKAFGPSTKSSEERSRSRKG
jgi:hypothetical protein